jgi:hypothetical protein
MIQAPTQSGKTMLARHIVRHLVQQKCSVVVIDPKGDLYYGLEEDLAAMKQEARTVLFDTSRKPVVGFNPIQRTGLAVADHAAWVAKAILSSWRQPTFWETAQMWRWLLNTMGLVIDTGATMTDALDILRHDDSLRRRQLVPRTNIIPLRREWLAFEELSATKKLEITAPAFARLKPFCENPLIEEIVSARESIDLGTILKNGEILLSHIPAFEPFQPDVAQMLRSLLLNMTAAQAFNIRERPPLYLVIDEAQYVMQHDADLLEELLNVGSSRGIHPILIFHTFAQTAKVNPGLLPAMLSHCKTKIVGGGIPQADLQVLTEEMFTEDWHPYIVKVREKKLIQEMIESTRTQRGESESWNRNLSKSDGGSSSEGSSYASYEGWGRSEGESSGTVEGESGGKSKTSGSSETESSSGGTSWSHSRQTGKNWSTGRGRGKGGSKSKTTVPFHEIKKHWYYKDEYLSLGEFLATRLNKTKSQSVANFVIKYMNERAAFFEAVRIYPLRGREHLPEFRKTIYEKPYYARPSVVTQEEEKGYGSKRAPRKNNDSRR